MTENTAVGPHAPELLMCYQWRQQLERSCPHSINSVQTTLRFWRLLSTTTSLEWYMFLVSVYVCSFAGYVKKVPQRFW